MQYFKVFLSIKILSIKVKIHKFVRHSNLNVGIISNKISDIFEFLNWKHYM